mgnify:CR=1 FL=1
MQNVDEKINALRAVLAEDEERLSAVDAMYVTQTLQLRHDIESVKKSIRSLEMQKLPECDACNGLGIADPGYHNVGCACSKCGGTGRVAVK